MTLRRAIAPAGRRAAVWQPNAEHWLSLEAASRHSFNQDFRAEVARICELYLLRFSQSCEAVHIAGVRKRNERLRKGVASALSALSSGAVPEASLEKQAFEREFWAASDDLHKKFKHPTLHLSMLADTLESSLAVSIHLAALLEEERIQNAADSEQSNVQFFVCALADAFDNENLPVSNRRDAEDLQVAQSSFPAFAWALWSLLPERDTRPVSKTAMNQRIAELLPEWRAARSEKHPS